MSLLLLLACATDPCDRYADLPFARGRCLAQHAADAPDIGAARCSEAGEAEEDCRITWVHGHLDRGIDELLAACTSEECRFIALDFRPSPLFEQLPRCEALANLAENCVNHALVRYVGGSPTAAALAEDVPRLGRWAVMAASEAGNARRCGHPIDCAGFGALAATCEAPAVGIPDCAVYRPDFPRGSRGASPGPR